MAKKQPVEEGATEAASDQSGIVRANINRETEISRDFLSVYANDAQIQLTPWDVRLIFGLISNIPAGENPVVTVRQVGEVRFSLPLAKRIAMILIGQIQHYEKTIGPIPLPQD